MLEEATRCWITDSLDAPAWHRAEQREVGPADETGVEVLTPRQREILDLAADGLLNKQIAYKLDITVATVKAHVSEAIRRLRAANRTHAVAICLRADHQADLARATRAAQA